MEVFGEKTLRDQIAIRIQPKAKDLMCAYQLVALCSSVTF